MSAYSGRPLGVRPSELVLLLNALSHELTEYRHILKTPDLPTRLHTQIAHQHRLVTKLSDVLEGTL